MGPAFYLLAILGCGEGEVACEQVAVQQAQYSSAEECNAATEQALLQHMDAAYPVVVAQCTAAGAITSSVSPSEVRLPSASPQPRIVPASYSRPQKRRG